VIQQVLWHARAMPTLGWSAPFRPRPWAEIRALLNGMTGEHPQFQYVADIANSVVDLGATELLAGITSMHDLLVAPVPVGDPPDVIAVRARGSLHPPKDGHVLIEHLAYNGRNDRIERPTTEAVPLFWRFVSEKFGIRPSGPSAASEPL
jgi:hypothetical protein